MSSCNKTPVAILHELCVHKNITEQFSVIRSTGTPNDPVFDMCVETTSGLRAVGSGKTKKEAKHNAAKAMLEQMDVPAITQGEVTQPAPSVTNPHTERNASGNAIGRLQEYCSQTHLPAPTYELIGDEGEPHNRTFSIRCEVSQRYEIGISRTKQQAKHNAAESMLQNLQKNPSLSKQDVVSAALGRPKPVINKLTPEELGNVTDIYSKCRPVTSLPVTSPGLKFSLYHDSMRAALESVRIDLETDSFSAPTQMLTKLVEKMSLVLSYHPGHTIADLNELAEKTTFIYAVVNTQPTTVQIGAGDSAEEATVRAALSVLKYWQTFVGHYSPTAL